MAIPYTVPGGPLLPVTAAQIASQFTQPLVVGGPGLISGSALLGYRFDIDYTGGDFTGIAINFPAGSIIWKLLANITPAFNGTTPIVRFGTTAAGAQLGSFALTPAGASEGPTSPAVVGAPPANGTIYCSATLGGSTAGHASLAILYLG